MNDMTGADTIESGGQDDADARTGNVEEEARRLGWKPEEEARAARKAAGKSEDIEYLDAKSYLDRTLSSVPMMRERLRLAERRESESNRKFDEASRRLDETAKALADFVKHSQESERNAEVRGYERAMAEINARRSEAVKSGDVAAFEAAEAERVALEARKPAPPKPAANEGDGKDKDKAGKGDQQAQIHPDTVAWIEENRGWYEDETRPELNAYAVTMHNVIARRFPNLSLKQNLAKVKEAVMKQFPDDFPGEAVSADDETGADDGQTRRENPNRRAPPAVRQPAGGAGDRRAVTGKKTYHDLPEEAKIACDRMCRLIKDFTREKYLANYKW